MKRTLKSIIPFIALGVAALSVAAQPALKIVTVDMGKLLDGHYKAEEQMAKLREREQKAQEELERQVKELNQVVEQYKASVEQSKNTLLTNEARSKADGDAQKFGEDIQRRQGEAQNFRAKSQQLLQQTLQQFRNLLIDEISKKVLDIAKAKGATLVVDKFGPSGLGVSPVLYSDAAYDVTDEVMAAINKDRPPAPAATTPAAAPAPAPAATTETPAGSVPGLSPKK